MWLPPSRGDEYQSRVNAVVCDRPTRHAAIQHIIVKMFAAEEVYRRAHNTTMERHGVMRWRLACVLIIASCIGVWFVCGMFPKANVSAEQVRMLTMEGDRLVEIVEAFAKNTGGLPMTFDETGMVLPVTHIGQWKYNVNTGDTSPYYLGVGDYGKQGIHIYWNAECKSWSVDR